jgi:hypothetical protein
MAETVALVDMYRSSPLVTILAATALLAAGIAAMRIATRNDLFRVPSTPVLLVDDGTAESSEAPNAPTASYERAIAKVVASNHLLERSRALLAARAESRETAADSVALRRRVAALERRYVRAVAAVASQTSGPRETGGRTGAARPPEPGGLPAS